MPGRFLILIKERKMDAPGVTGCGAGFQPLLSRDSVSDRDAEVDVGAGA
jgi:hypothetical protein